MTLPILKSIATLTVALIAMAGSTGTVNAATLGDALSGVDYFAQPKLNVYPDNETTVEVTLIGANGPGGPGDGSVTKTINVRDNSKLSAVNR